MVSSDDIPTRTVLGVSIAALRLKEISSTIVRLIEEGARYKTASGKDSHKTASGKVRYQTVPGKKTFFYVDANHFNIAQKDPVYKRILQKATFVHASGIGPVLASRILGQPLPERTPTPDFIQQVFAVAEMRGWSFYLLGGEEDVVLGAVERIKKKFPGIKIVGYHHGFFADDKEIIKKINSASPDIVLVGMGPPKQEKWIEKNKDQINAKVFWAVGALFDVLSEKRKRGPKWMQDVGFEWIFRLFQEPKRLWRRYIFGNTAFLFIVLREKVASFRKSSRSDDRGFQEQEVL